MVPLSITWRNNLYPEGAHNFLNNPYSRNRPYFFRILTCLGFTALGSIGVLLVGAPREAKAIKGIRIRAIATSLARTSLHNADSQDHGKVIDCLVD